MPEDEMGLINDEEIDSKDPEKAHKKRKYRGFPVYLMAQEVNELLSKVPAYKKDHRMLMLVMLKCGLRVSEVLHLEVTDINIEMQNLHVREGKGCKDRTVPIIYMYDEMVAWLEHRPPVGSLFAKEITRNGVYKMVQRYAKSAGITKKVTPHTLRHTFAVNTYLAGVNAINLQNLLGHERFETTAIYIKLTQKDAAEDMKRHPLPY
jgi:site-specific recombinase XerD